MIKNKPSYPFETIAVAVAFSPRTEAIICEAKRLVDLLKAKFILIHIGKKSVEKEEKLIGLLKKQKVDVSQCKIIWEDGPQVDTLLKICKENVVDLLVAGAIEKENLLKYYLGSVSRALCRRAKCSVLTLINPSLKQKPFKKIVVNVADHPKTPHSISTAMYLAKNENTKEVHLIKEVDLSVIAMGISDDSTKPEARKMKKEMIDEEKKSVDKLMENVDPGGIEVITDTILGKPGYAVGHYAHRVHSDLLVLNSPDKKTNILDRIFAHDMEYILADLPCNLLIVHSRVNG